jgi:hypothetical protein
MAASIPGHRERKFATVANFLRCWMMASREFRTNIRSCPASNVIERDSSCAHIIHVLEISQLFKCEEDLPFDDFVDRN